MRMNKFFMENIINVIEGYQRIFKLMDRYIMFLERKIRYYEDGSFFKIDL